MAERELIKYKFGFANLIGDCNKIHTHACRDVAELSDFGIDQTYLDNYEAEIDVFEENPTDEDLLTDWMLASDQKNKLRQELEPMLTKVITRAKLAFEMSSAEFKQFRVSGFPSMREDTFLSEARRLKRAAEEHLSALAVFGLTQSMINDIDSKTGAYETAMESMADAAGKRTSATTARISKANALYDKMMKICRVGKEIWRNTSASRRNDYLIYRGARGRSKKKPAEDGETE